uniref:Protein kinase domain-containing protein n=1 Tax=Leersia perrieri TaxID=77586 RepID=A0A0D9XV37_9ORYZ
MAQLQWDGMERVATFAQLTGVDALGLISTILQAAQAVRRNKETCQELVQEIQLIRDLLRMLQDPEMMCREEIVNALSGLEGTLKEAYTLVTSCRDCSAMYRFFMGWKQADQFRRIKKKIAKHLRFYPMISHADLTRRLEKLATSAALSTCSSQDAQEVQASSSTSHPNPELRSDSKKSSNLTSLRNILLLPKSSQFDVQNHFRAAEVPHELEKGQEETQSTDNDEEHHQAGYHDATQTSSDRKSRSWWHDMIPSNKSADAAKAHIVPRAVELFTLAELAMATMNFSLDRKIGTGRFGTVYRGKLPEGHEVAIKRKTEDSGYLGMEEFRAEVTIHSLLHHKHIVHLIGCCVVEKEKRWSSLRIKVEEERMLVFEYMKNGSLSDHLHGPSTSSPSSPVTASWKMRIEILLGASRAIDYLHSYAVPPVIHRNIKPANILLDSSWVPHLSDFSLAVTCDDAEFDDIPIAGTRGYLDPEYLCTGTPKPASDVYSFGAVMLEVLSGRKPLSHWQEEDSDGDSPMDLVSDTLQLIRAGRVLDVLDRRPTEEPTIRQFEAVDLVARTAVHCLQEKGEDRPAMSDIVARLQEALEFIRCDNE